MHLFLTLILAISAVQNPPTVGSVAKEKPSVQAHVGKGYEFEKDELFFKAAEEFEQALALAPELSRVRYQLGVCYFSLGRDDDARREFLRVRSETSDDPSVVYMIARLDLAAHRLDAAIHGFESIVAKPPFPDTAYYLGSAYLESGRLTDAEKWLKAAQPLNPRDFRIPDHLARVHQREGRAAEAEKEYALSAQLRLNYNQAAAEAIECSQALEKDESDGASDPCAKLFRPDDPDRLTLLGMTYGQHGRYDKAVQPLERAAALDPDSYEIEHNLGLTYFRLQRYSDARAPLERAVALRPDFFESNALLGATLFMMRQDSEAYRVLQHAHRLNPADADTVDLLFKVASVLGAKSFEAKNYHVALTYLRVARDLKPDDPLVHARLAEAYGQAGNAQQAQAEKQMARQLASRQ
ncbi:MAG TPA: tetratricopeptide repeat protein [Terriglobia bacterium]|nr:tetratricopeptide repeat protein [Terriglobia bacterium]